MELLSLLEHSPITNPLWELEWAFQNDFAYIFYTLAVIFGFVLAFAVGANDSANSWGTPIGAGTISLRMAFLLGFIFETLGALFLSRWLMHCIPLSKYNVDAFLFQWSHQHHCWQRQRCQHEGVRSERNGRMDKVPKVRRDLLNKQRDVEIFLVQR